MIAGVDGYKKQWIVVYERSDGTTAIEVAPDFQSILERPESELAVIDVPIGLLDRGTRACDVAARKALGPRRSSVFPAPIRPMLAARSWEEAAAIREQVEGKRCSQQVFGILPLIRSVDQLMRPDLQGRIREGHPEASFAILAGAPMPVHKSKPAGRKARISLLQHEFPDLDQQLRVFDRSSALTDVLDAYALLWTARRVRDGRAEVFPREPELDSHGLRAEIVA